MMVLCSWCIVSIDLTQFSSADRNVLPDLTMRRGRYTFPFFSSAVTTVIAMNRIGTVVTEHWHNQKIMNIQKAIYNCLYVSLKEKDASNYYG